MRHRRYGAAHRRSPTRQRGPNVASITTPAGWHSHRRHPGYAAADPALPGADHIVLEFSGDQPATLRHRYLYGPVVDQIFAREDVESLWQPGEVIRPLRDHLGTVWDILDSAGKVVNHLRYDSFGRITSETDAAVHLLIASTGRERDEESGLYYYRAHYYDPESRKFVSEDPIGFAAGTEICSVTPRTA